MSLFTRIGAKAHHCLSNARHNRTYTPLSVKKMMGKPPVLPKVTKQNIHRIFKLDKKEEGVYRAEYHGEERRQNIYGGLLFAQGLEAVELDVEKCFLPASFHSLFVAYALVTQPIEYKVERLRDGKTFCARSVTGTQNGRVVFSAIANFSKPAETSIQHNVQIPDVPKPNQLVDFFDYCEDRLAEIKAGKLKVPKLIEENFERRMFDKPYSVLDVRCVDPEKNFMLKSFKNEPLYYWIKSSVKLDPNNPRIHRSLVAYLSDMYLVSAAVYPHITHGNEFSLIASLDNSIWFHNYDFKADDENDWLLYEVHSPIADSGRAISHGKVWCQNGLLIATTVQDILARFVDKSKL